MCVMNGELFLMVKLLCGWYNIETTTEPVNLTQCRAASISRDEANLPKHGYSPFRHAKLPGVPWQSQCQCSLYTCSTSKSAVSDADGSLVSPTKWAALENLLTMVSMTALALTK